ncbi:MAG TPA: type II toxin-antitoxin system VapC family toxin [Thermoanaerobaculales bacterium]|nr:type II toxin-antitoxin system VapC family toxin [Thermoanaerobaculales bacterium]HPA82835.1 type II toxin-antitoxin system VapC family toxin [Thermoanaerobaculales bacterium]HQN96227.1 type II toxin-antitoxin system VapC family toxin [Thermoanaerobaculales bacterium]
MTPLVVDCSVTMAWCFEDECDELADAVLDRLVDGEAWVPSLWPLEVSNVLVAAERRRRITAADSARFIELLMGLPIVVDDRSHERALSQVLAVARQLDISAYDASYLELAMRLGATLATRDALLQAAAAAAGVPLFAAK